MVRVAVVRGGEKEGGDEAVLWDRRAEGEKIEAWVYWKEQQSERRGRWKME